MNADRVPILPDNSGPTGMCLDATRLYRGLTSETPSDARSPDTAPGLSLRSCTWVLTRSPPSPCCGSLRTPDSSPDSSSTTATCEPLPISGISGVTSTHQRPAMRTQSLQYDFTRRRNENDIDSDLLPFRRPSPASISVMGSSGRRAAGKHPDRMFAILCKALLWMMRRQQRMAMVLKQS